jgi:MSHA biogenesis protein MshI
VLSLLNKLLLRKALRHDARAGIALGEGSFALAVVRRDGVGKPALDHCGVHAAASDPVPALKSVLDKLGIARTPTCAVIGGDDYQIVQVEAPDVLQSEMRAAIRWRLRDVINFSVDEATVDVFEIPDPIRRTQGKMLFAVAARLTAVQRVAASVRAAAKCFDSIDIPELCLRNLSALLPQDHKGVAMLALNDRFAQLVITRQGVMYLTRRIETGRFDADSRDGTPIDAGALALEIQRSLDYYESHYDQTPVGDLVIAPPDARAQRLAGELKNETSLRVSTLDVRDLFSVAQSGEVVTDWHTLMALGAALRDDKVEL